MKENNFLVLIMVVPGALAIIFFWALMVMSIINSGGYISVDRAEAILANIKIIRKMTLPK